MTSGGREWDSVGCDSSNYQLAVNNNTYRCVEGESAMGEDEAA
jgi:hypothetical protein